MKYKKYSSYKDSGVEWLGEIPESWDARRLGFYFKERREKVSDKVFSPLSVTKNGIVPQLENAAKSDDGDNRKKVCKGDFVINSRSDRKGSSGLSQLDGSVSLINTVIEPKNINENYIHYLLKSQPFQEEYYRYGKGIVADLWSTNYSEMKNIIISSPTLKEQQQIANFLDKATAKIDTLIEKQTKQIELLKEKRQAVISHAVTKGINPNVPMKDSGVEWLGEIPEHWEVKKLKFVLQLLNKKEKIINQIVVALENIESWSGKYIESDSSYQGDDVAFCIGDILFGKLRPYLAKVFLCSFDGIAFGDLLAYRPIKDYASKYAFYSLISEDFIKIVDSSTYGTKMPRASSEFLSEMRLTVPPLKEQQQIANYLDEKTSKIDILIEKSNKSIELLKEKRTAIISAAVTGKIDVRGLA
ncbi:restriction endonuclease subunit S [Aliarcobacter cryaerophilus]|uniref:restriction endonuclease subunit S n=1 Tax=Aliarcobacter cryaerophilus TaxID=28198 RepID=UPI0021B59D39|nr:restriction endonuclease subunit S [Aliarcobacter cryaerophilus]MCT7524900.1 restriction endonuclease subunit S [Aliarcobacter cryaerophilus]